MSKRSISTFLHLHPDSSFSSIPAHLYIPLTTRRQHALTALFFMPSVTPPTHPPPPPPPFRCSYQHKGHLRLYEDDIPVSRWCGVMWNVQHLLFAAAMPFHLSHYWISLLPPTPPPSVFIFTSAFQMLDDWICSLPAEVPCHNCGVTNHTTFSTAKTFLLPSDLLTTITTCCNIQISQTLCASLSNINYTFMKSTTPVCCMRPKGHRKSR